METCPHCGSPDCIPATKEQIKIYMPLRSYRHRPHYRPIHRCNICRTVWFPACPKWAAYTYLALGVVSLVGWLGLGMMCYTSRDAGSAHWLPRALYALGKVSGVPIIGLVCAVYGGRTLKLNNHEVEVLNHGVIPPKICCPLCGQEYKVPEVRLGLSRICICGGTLPLNVRPFV